MRYSFVFNFDILQLLKYNSKIKKYNTLNKIKLKLKKLVI